MGLVECVGDLDIVLIVYSPLCNWFLCNKHSTKELFLKVRGDVKIPTYKPHTNTKGPL